MALTQVDQGLLGTYAQYTGFKNRIINGAMMIDQRNAGAAYTPNQSDGSVKYLVDRFGYSATQASKVTWQQSTTVPTGGFKNSLSATVASSVASPAAGDQFLLTQAIEGLNVADLNFGSASASSITLSFWVRSSVTGTYSVSLQNNAFNRTYITTYSIPVANTWTQINVTVVGDTSGTWTTDTTAGLRVNWDLGSGSNDNGTSGVWATGLGTRTSGSVNWISNAGATFYITGVQLEKGSTATSFDYRPYGTELALCQRYCYFMRAPADNVPVCPSSNYNASYAYGIVTFPVTMRAAPSLTVGGTASGYQVYSNNGGANASAVTLGSVTQYVSELVIAASLTSGSGSWLRYGSSVGNYLNFSAEL